MRVSTRLWWTVNISRSLMTEYDKNFLEWYKDPEEKKNTQSILNFSQLFPSFDVLHEAYSSHPHA